MDEKRRIKSKKTIDKKSNSEEKRINFVEDFERFLETQEKKTGKSEHKLMEDILSSHVALIEFDETLGKASLVFENWKGVSIGEPLKIDQKTLKDFRDLRDNFAPVSAGIEWHKDFTSGGGFLIQIDDPKDAHQKEMRNEVKRFCTTVFQDQYVIGLDAILDVMMDMALTDGCAAAEIVYEKEVDFNEYLDEATPVEEIVGLDGKKIKVLKPKVMTDALWKGLGGITRLKIIEDSYTRLIPYRHPISGEVLYWTLDEKTQTPNAGLTYEEIVNREKKKVIIKFHPWEIFWLSWNKHGTNLKGLSLIQPVYHIAKMAQTIQTSVGKGYNRWANKKYFFVAGTERRPWNKVYRQEFLKAVEKMIANNWVGTPVPWGFDIKEIGGEQSIFDGKNILDHLISMIAAGMQYPLDFLESGRTQASDKSWLAWTVRYGRSQNQVRRALEHQIFERHLWCKFGSTVKETRKGPNQKDLPIYIPKLQWKAEGQWLKDAKMKTLTGLLNVANPIDFPLKIPIQKEMGATLGIGEIDWTEIEELFDVQNKTRLANAKIEKLKIEAKLKVFESMTEEELAKISEPQPQKPKTDETPEEKLTEQGEKRQEGGVSRTTKETGTKSKKGQAKPMGGTRKVGETMETSETTEIELPKEVEDEIKKRALDSIEGETKKVELEQKKFDLEVKRKKKKSLEKIDEEMDKINKKESEKENAK